MSFENFISEFSVPASLCDTIVEDFNQKKFYHRDSNDFREYTYVSDSDMNENLMVEYVTKLNTFVSEYTNSYPGFSMVAGPLKLHLPFNIQYYPPGKHYSKLHCENKIGRAHV